MPGALKILFEHALTNYYPRVNSKTWI